MVTNPQDHELYNTCSEMEIDPFSPKHIFRTVQFKTTIQDTETASAAPVTASSVHPESPEGIQEYWGMAYRTTHTWLLKKSGSATMSAESNI